jgi:hypothetical protein
VNTGPLIFLAGLGRLDLLSTGPDSIYVAEAVAREIRAKPDEAAHAFEVACLSWLSLRPVTNRQAVEILLADLGPGEAETIVLAKEVGAELVVMDDLDARRFAHRIGLRVIGTLGLLLAARLDGRISSLSQEVEKLTAAGFYAAPDLVERLLREAGELPTR